MSVQPVAYHVNMTDVNRKMVVGIGVITAELAAWARVRVEEIYDISQDLAPVDTGALKASGRIEIDNVGPLPAWKIVYGGEVYGIDYAAWAEMINGTPYLEPAIQQVLGGD
jgi:hypothetical protein